MKIELGYKLLNDGLTARNRVSYESSLFDFS